jgi:hypothetical protein
LDVPIPILPPLVILILSNQLPPNEYVENTMSLVGVVPGFAIPKATDDCGPPPPAPKSFQNSITPLPPASTNGDFVPGAAISTT